MLIRTFDKCRRLFRSTNGTCKVNGLYSTEQFHDLLDRERGRSDRNSHGFALVIFELRSDKRNEQALTLGKMFVGRMRATDTAGWIDSHRVGVFLPETHQDGARTFADHICRDVATRDARPPAYTIRTYPSQHASGSGPRAGGRREDESSSRREENAERHPSAVATGNRNAESPAVACGGGRETASDDRQEILKLCAAPIPKWKRGIDVVGALTGLILCAPLMCLVTALIKIVSPGPVFFRQERVGHLGRRFSMWKFRTMHVDNDVSAHRDYLVDLIHDEGEDKPMVKREDNPNIIRFGRILRAASIDEIPQLFNVLRGEMSLVGPRPPIPYEAEEYLRWHANRLETVPGMTGLWQVSGKNRLTFKEMVRLDIRYARTMNLWQDVRILLKTFPVVVSMAFEKVAVRFAKEEPDDGISQQAA
ncbi:sugar transferase [Candidatus Sumerlaeota bacterium]|nr:sugar transferase [Candidatus Sumerlaeota bacterium]